MFTSMKQDAIGWHVFRLRVPNLASCHSMLPLDKESTRQGDDHVQVDKLTANQKLDLNLERGRLRDDLQQLRDKLSTLRNSLEREVNLVRTDMESSKSDTLKWVVVTVVGLLGAGFAAIRLSIH
jgi:hypothetical protein